MNRYRVTMRHDSGRAVLTIPADTPEAAARIACECERAPRSAVESVTLTGSPSLATCGHDDALGAIAGTVCARCARAAHRRAMGRR